MRQRISIALAIIALATISAAGCGTESSNADLQSTGLKATPKLTPQQIQAAWEVKHPGEKAPL